MLHRLELKGYRSLENLRVPLQPLTVVTGPNGTGKSNLYRCLQLTSRAARGELAAALVEEGGMPSVLWSGPRRRTSRKAAPAAFEIGWQGDRGGYRFACGLPVPGQSAFNLDPDVTSETAWLGPVDRPSLRFLKRTHGSVTLRGADSEWVNYTGVLDGSESALSQIQDPRRFADVEELRGEMAGWRFYHQFRTDAGSPLRQPRPATRTPRLAGDGHDLAAALQTIVEIGDPVALARAVNRMQPGAQIGLACERGWIELGLRTPGLLRTLHAREFSDGTLRYLALVAALLSPRPAPLLAFNEPETSLHPDLLPALAEQFVLASQRSQIWVTTHSEPLAAALQRASGAATLRLTLVNGATRIVGQSATGELLSEDEENAPEDDR